MQQRYYDPQVGLFLSVDPVVAYSNPVGQFHRYRYANNNPYKFTDPDGREVEYKPGGGVTDLDVRRFMVNLAFSPTAQTEMMQIEQSDLLYKIVIDPRATNWYDHRNRIIYINPNRTLQIKSSGKLQSSTVNAGHEISHAAEHDRVGDVSFENALKQEIVPEGKKVSPEEQRAVETEKKIGQELAEPTRINYQDVYDERLKK